MRFEPISASSLSIPAATVRLAGYARRMIEAVEHILGPDRRVRVSIHRRADGWFECSLDRFHVDDLPKYGHGMEYRATAHRWGIYDSAATARCEAAAEFPRIGNGNPPVGS